MNLGKFIDEIPDKEAIINFFKGSELQQYFIDLFNNKSRVVYKPQNITLIPKHVSGKVYDLLKKNDIWSNFDDL